MPAGPSYSSLKNNPPARTALDEGSTRRWHVWLLILGASLLWHLLALTLPWQNLFQLASLFRTPPRVELESVDSQTLDRIRRQWQEKKFLMKQAPTPESEKNKNPAVDRARYYSNSTQSVRQETRARNTEVIPHVGGGGAQKKLSELGVPLDLRAQTDPSQTIAISQQREQTRTRAQESQWEDPNEGEGYTLDQSLLDEKDLPEGERNILNTREFEHYSFYARVYEAVGPIWSSRVREILSSHRIASGDYETHVDVMLDRRGEVVRVRYLKASGVRSLDDAVEQAWFKVRRFPNPPQALIEQDGHLHFRMRFSVGAGR